MLRLILGGAGVSALESRAPDASSGDALPSLQSFGSAGLALKESLSRTAQIAEHSGRSARIIVGAINLRIGEHVNVMTRALSRRWATPAALLVTVGGLVGTMAAARAAVPSRGVPGFSYRVSSSVKVYPGDTPRGQDDEVMRGRGVAAHDHSRIEFLAFTPTPSGVTTDDYLIGGDSGKTYIFHNGSQTFADANDTFGGPAVVALGRVMGGGGRGAGGPPRGGGGGGGFPGRAGRGGGAAGARGARGGRGRGGVGQGFLGQVELLDVKFNLEDLGGADSIEGRPAKHYRVTADYRVIWGDEALPAHAVTELWTVALPTKIPNPFEPLVVADQSGDGPLIEYALKLRAVRAKIDGVPVKVVTTTTLSGVKDILGLQGLTAGEPDADTLHVVQQTQITNIQPADVDPKQVMVPEFSGQ
jgi:hypothetical protein